MFVLQDWHALLGGQNVNVKVRQKKAIIFFKLYTETTKECL